MRIGNLIVALLLIGIFVAIIIYNPLGGEQVAPYPTTRVLSVGDVVTSEWNGEFLGQPSVLYDEQDKLYKMWYVARGTALRGGVGYATSTDGRAWDRAAVSGPVVIPRDQWEAAGIRSVTVVKDRNTYHMWYSAADNYDDDPRVRIGYAISSDGVSWAQSAGNPVFEPPLTSDWDNLSLDDPSVTRVGDEWVMWYSGKGTGEKRRVSAPAIGMAKSADGLQWSRVGDPVFSGGAEWAAEGVQAPDVRVYNKGELYEMWFAGTSDGDRYALGRAFSSDGMNWVEDEVNPIMADRDDSLTAPTWRFADGTYTVWLQRTLKRGGLSAVHVATYTEPTGTDAENAQ